MTTKKNRKSRIDGLYYLNAAMLREANACGHHYNRWVGMFGTVDVPITADVIRKMHFSGEYTCGWAAIKMLESSLVTEAEKEDFEIAYYYEASSDRKERHAFIELLEKRARREGRLS